MGTLLLTCYRCNAKITLAGKVSRRDSCDSCGVSLHACKFCEFYDRKSYNECRETSADRVVDKEKENFCDFFKPQNQAGGTDGGKVIDAKAAAQKKLDDLFK